MEKVPTDDDDRPKQEVKITGATIFVNPYKDEEEAERKAAKEARLKVTFRSNLCRVQMHDVQMAGQVESAPEGPATRV